MVSRYRRHGAAGEKGGREEGREERREEVKVGGFRRER